MLPVRLETALARLAVVEIRGLGAALGVALAFFSTLLPSFMVNLAISKVGPQATSAVGMIAPISTILLAIFVLGEPFGFLDGVGTFITVAGIGLYTYFDKRAAKSR